MDTFHQKIPIGRPVLLATKAVVASSLGGKSPGTVLTHALYARRVLASDIAGYRDVMSAGVR